MSAAPPASAAPCEKPFCDCLRRLGRRDHHDPRQRMGARLLAAFQIVDAIQRVARELGHGAAEAFIGEDLGRRARQRQRERGDARARRGADGRCTARRQVLRVISSREEGAFEPRPTSNTRSARMPSRSVKPGFPGFGGEVTALEEPREFFAAAQVESIGFGGEFAVVVDADGDTIDGQLGEPFVQISNCMFTLALSRRVGCFKVAKCNPSLVRWACCCGSSIATSCVKSSSAGCQFLAYY